MTARYVLATVLPIRARVQQTGTRRCLTRQTSPSSVAARPARRSRFASPRWASTRSLFERQREPEWRACGVFSSPLTRDRLVDLGSLDATTWRTLARPISALRLETIGGAACRIEYAHGHANGFDRVRLDAALLDRARDAGADVRTATVVRSIELPATARRLRVRSTCRRQSSRDGGERRTIKARVVVGADGPGSIVARAGALGGRSRLEEVRPDVPADGPGRRARRASQWKVGSCSAAAGTPASRPCRTIGSTSASSCRATGSRRRPSVVADRLIGRFPGPPDAWMTRPSRTTTASPARSSIARGECRTGLPAGRRRGRLHRSAQRRGPASRSRFERPGGGVPSADGWPATDERWRTTIATCGPDS